MALHNDGDKKAVPHKFEIVCINGDIVTLKALWIKTYVNGSIDIGCDLDDNSAKVYALSMLDGKLSINHSNTLSTLVKDGVVEDPDVLAGDAVIDNIGFFSRNEIIRYLQGVRVNNIKLLSTKPNRVVEPKYDTPESLMYTGEYHSGLKNRGATPGELLCILAHLYHSITTEELSKPEVKGAVLDMTTSTIAILESIVVDMSVVSLYFGDNIDIILGYINDNNVKALVSISNLWKSSSYGATDLKPLFIMYEKIEEQKIEEEKAEKMKEEHNKKEEEAKKKNDSSKKEEKKDEGTFYTRNKKSIITAGIVGGIAVGYGIFRALGGSDSVVIVD